MSTTLIALAAALAVLPTANARTAHDLDLMWQRFQADHKRVYSTDQERGRHFAAFTANILMARDLNAKQGINCTDLFDDKDCVFGITKYSDESPDHLRRTLLAHQPSPADARSRAPILSTHLLGATDETVVDWRAKGVVTAVNNQGKCGSCWAFSITQEMESAYAIATGKLRKLSQQQIISCDRACVDGHGDCGCDGGDVVTGSEYVHQVGGLAALDDYPDVSSLTGISGNCSAGVRPAVKLVNFSYAVPPCNHSRDPRDERPCNTQDEVGLAKVVASKGPVSVSLTWGPGWWSYKGGIYDSIACSNTVADIDHAMQIVGYNMSGDKPYWIVRNTNGADWGIAGYIHMAMGKNLCGIANEAVLVEVEPASHEQSMA